jgi:large subunit ribosomal protein L18
MASNQKKTGRRRRQERVRKKVLGTDARPRVCVFRSNKHIYAQVISDDRGMTLVSASTLSTSLPDAAKGKRGKGVEAAKQVAGAGKICQEKRSLGWFSIATGFSSTAR